MQTEAFINRVEQAGINDRTVATNVTFGMNRVAMPLENPPDDLAVTHCDIFYQSQPTLSRRKIQASNS